MLRGSPAEIAEAVAILENLDRPAMQVTISCIIVELKRGRNFEIGLHSGSTRKTLADSLAAARDTIQKDVIVTAETVDDIAKAIERHTTISRVHGLTTVPTRLYTE